MFAVLDVETTGLRPARDRVIEIAIVTVDDDGKVTDEWCTLINPGRSLGAIYVHRITRNDIAEAPTFDRIVGDVFERLTGNVVVAHNARFDAAMLAAELRRAGHETSIEWFCTLQLVKRVGFDSQRSLRRCCENLGVTHDEGHDALVDSRAAANLLTYLLAAAHERGLRVDIPRPLHLVGLPLPVPYGSAIRRRPSSTPAPPLRRLVAQAQPIAALTHLDGEAATAYLGLLDTVLEDRLLAADEVSALVELAGTWGLDLDDLRSLHESYAGALVAAAMADGVLSGDEHRDLVSVVDLLGVPRERVADQLQRLLP